MLRSISSFVVKRLKEKRTDDLAIIGSTPIASKTRETDKEPDEQADP